MAVRPLVGISSWREVVGERGPDGGVESALTHITYVKAVAKAGGVPVVLPQLEPSDVDAVLDGLGAVVLVGGPDVSPSSYGAVLDPRTVPATAERDAYDVALARRCVERDHPLLAVCRGVQVLNVASGGTLLQHVDGHMVRERYNETVHEVRLEAGSTVAKVMGAERIEVNSLHHQALDRLGEGVRAVGWSGGASGTVLVEAIEIDGAPRVLGVQWHPELLRHRPDHLALFEHLVELAGVEARP